MISNAKKDALKSFLAQCTIAVDDGNLILTKKNTYILSARKEVTKAEIVDAPGYAERYRLMFSERNPVTSAYRMCETKVAYVIRFGIAQYVRRKLIKDVADTLFSFLFDETANSQVKKQYDGYVMYWSKQDRRVVH